MFSCNFALPIAEICDVISAVEKIDIHRRFGKAERKFSSLVTRKFDSKMPHRTESFIDFPPTFTFILPHFPLLASQHLSSTIDPFLLLNENVLLDKH